MDPFSSLIPDARAFLSELADNNTRDWFNTNKSRYEATLKTPATLLMDQVAYDMGRELGFSLTPKLFRPQRDVRFSKDKTPYQTHLHMLWTINAQTRQSPGFFFGISEDYVSIGGGIMGFDKPVLTDFRNAVDGPFGDDLHKELDALVSQGLVPSDPELKRVPAPFDKAHRHADLLRRKGIVLWRAVPPRSFAKPLAELNNGFTALKPLLSLLQQVL